MLISDDGNFVLLVSAFDFSFLALLRGLVIQNLNACLQNQGFTPGPLFSSFVFAVSCDFFAFCSSLIWSNGQMNSKPQTPRLSPRLSQGVFFRSI